MQAPILASSQLQSHSSISHWVYLKILILMEIICQPSTHLNLGTKDLNSVALIEPHANHVSLGDYVFFNTSLNSCELWLNDELRLEDAVQAAQLSDVAIMMVGTWSLDQTLDYMTIKESN
ncbi:hypothetical protein BYT27DRAFT_7253227 [Phlegmacium glaucopus]|nr:hypothetical protein BYT27DRAFT_7253227 [Phlegmacium glaucopus]